MLLRMVGSIDAMASDIRIRQAGSADRAALREAIIELQEFERRLSNTRRPGEAIADAYLARMESRSADRGAILIAEAGGAFVGFATCRLCEVDYISETADSNRFGYVSDICVLPA